MRRKTLFVGRVSMWFVSLIFGLFLGLGSGAPSQAAAITCTSGYLPASPNQASTPDLLVTGDCHVQPSQTYYYGAVNVLAKGRLVFDELGDQVKPTVTDFWASSILVENGGTLAAGDARQPYGIYGGVLTIHLFGADQSQGDPVARPGMGATCQSPVAADGTPCGISKEAWKDNGETLQTLPGGVKDFFYRYGPLRYDGKCSDGSIWSKQSRCDDKTGVKVGYFGYKVLAVSYGGSLELWGYKGSCNSLGCNDPTLTHASWARLRGSIKKGGGEGADDPIIVSGPSNYHPENISVQKGDQIVVTTTDYMPGHSEEFTVKDSSVSLGPKGQWLEKIWVEKGAAWPHNGERFPLAERFAKAGSRIAIDPDLVNNGVETRAAVAILNRSIRIVSGGDNAGDAFPDSTPEAPCTALDGKGPCYSFGGHMVIRQGFRSLHVKGVEFRQLGQGGRMARYPVHFHMVRQTPPNTFVQDSSINESMTRWIVLHSTQGVTLAGNVGYKSIGHGFYLEDGTEADNNFYSNLGIFARAAIANDQNPRRVAGILAANNDADPPAPQVANFPYLSDSAYPSVFWISNGWNNFVGNMAAGAGACGSSYWLVPMWNSDMTDVPTGVGMGADAAMHMKWSGYAGLQKNPDFRGATPLKSFVNNYATSTMMSFQTTGDVPDCHGVVKSNTPPSRINVVRMVRSIAPEPKDEGDDDYYPHAAGGNRHATKCKPIAAGGYDCDGVAFCDPSHRENCTVTVLDRFTSAFHWAETNVSAIWLRNQWYLLTNSVLSDIQSGGLTFITGGDYTHASAIKGYWALASKSVFIGHTQPQDADHAYASDAGPFNALTGLQCEWQKATDLAGHYVPSNYCLSVKDGISMPIVAFGIAQRLFNIYDGPAYEDSNVFLDVTKSDCEITGAGTKPGCIYGSGVALGVTRDMHAAAGKQCFLPNAAIAWKQPNGFFYPPAFHSKNLFFDNVEIRHFVFDPLFQPPDGVDPKHDFGQGGTYLTSLSGPNAVENAYCTQTSNMFDGWSGIDRQTELSDDDGSLTGLVSSEPQKDTVSVNEDNYFGAQVETSECNSNLRVSPSLACRPGPPPPPPPPPSAPSTARTSPYDYVATAIAPQCSQKDLPIGQKYGRCNDSPDLGQGGDWSSECSNGACYGVPLYRQYLTTADLKQWQTNGCDQNSNTPNCRWPFIRMSGQNMYQRETLTVNKGVYYVDTSVSKVQQNTEKFTSMGQTRDVNVFFGGQTYYMFFLYAKQSTAQTYQIYVGDKFDTSTVKPVRGSLATAPIKFDADGSGLKWFTVEGVSNGVLTIKTDFNLATELNPRDKTNGLCGPAAFCGWQGDGSCGSVLTASGPQKDPILSADPSFKKEADAVCRNWAVKDLDCPAKGCFGFSFTLDPGFTADTKGQTARPKPQSPAPWTAQFINTATAPDNASREVDHVEQECFYRNLPGSSSCLPPNP